MLTRAERGFFARERSFHEAKYLAGLPEWRVRIFAGNALSPEYGFVITRVVSVPRAGAAQ